MIYLRVAAGILLLVILQGLFLFATAGRWDIPMFWVYIVSITLHFLGAVYKVDPELMEERRRPGPGGKDHSLRRNAVIVFALCQCIAGLDVGRFHWSDSVPFPLQVLALTLILAGLRLATWATRVNRFFSSVARIQRDRGHRVVTSGPYHFIRHPGYAASLVLFLCTGVALGSWCSAGAGLLAIPLFLRRLFIEEGMLFAELEGYREYAAKVPYRLIPRVW